MKNLIFIAAFVATTLITNAQTFSEINYDGITLAKTTTASVISPEEGQIIYDTTLDQVMYFNGLAWFPMSEKQWEEVGADLRYTAGQVGVGVTPSDKFHVNAADGENAIRIQTDGITRFRVFENGGITVGSNWSSPVANTLRINTQKTTVNDTLQMSDGSGNLHIEATEQEGLKIFDAAGNRQVKIAGNTGNFEAPIEVDGGYYGIEVSNSTNDGIKINNAGAAGLDVSNSNFDGISVSSPGIFGARISNTGNAGVAIFSAGAEAVRIVSPTFDGINISDPGDQGVGIENPTTDGILVEDAGRYGMHIDKSASYGVLIDSSGSYGVYVNNAGSSSFRSENSASDGFISIDAGDDGISSINANDDGLFVNNSGDKGVHIINSTNEAIKVSGSGSGVDAVVIENAGDDGIYVNNSSSMGIRVNGSTSTGVYVANGSGIGIVSTSNASNAATFVGNISKSSGTFRIDHPMDPTNKYLYHSFVESPDMMNVYNGNVTLDSNGEAIVELPNYFNALNKDYRYQLTCVGGFANVYVAEKVNNNQFKIAGGNAGLEVSWQVTGIRQDNYANENRIVPEVEKPAILKGSYIHPEVYGADNTQSELYILYEKDEQKSKTKTERKDEN